MERSKEDFAEKYLTSNFLIRFLLRRFFNQIQKILSEINFKKVLEVGCGPGFSTQYLKEFLKDKDFEASEFREDLVKEAQKNNPEVKICQESIYELKRESNSFDLIIAFEVLEHLEKPEIALKELQRVTSKYCLLSVPNEPLWRILNICRLKYLKNFGNTPGHLQHWSKKEFQKLVNKYFEIVKIKIPLPWQIILAKKY